MNKLFLFAFLLIGSTLLFVSCGGAEEEKQWWEVEGQSNEDFSELDEKARQVFGSLEAIAENPNNPVTDEKVALGKALYFEKGLSLDNTQSCNTCHNLETYGVDNNPTSAGNNGGFGDRNSPTTLNAAFHMTQFWDGREPDVEAQAGGPILNPVEMEMPSEHAVASRLSGIAEYKEMFAAAFPDEASPITYDNLKKAIGAFERKLVTPSKFDKYIDGDNYALSAEEKKGMKAFMDAGCITCHSGALLGGTMYQKFGVYDEYWKHTKSEHIDEGRASVTGADADKYMFKVPSLRNIEKTYPYFHDGSVMSLNDAIKIMAKIQNDKDLTDEEVESIATFLKTLTGEVPADLKQ